MYRAILLLLAVLLFANPVFSQEKFILSTVKGSTDTIAGFSVVKEGYKRIGYEAEGKWLQGAKALEGSNSGLYDGEVQRIDGISSKFTNLVQIHVPVNFIQGVVFTKNVTFPVTGWYSLKPYRIGIVRGILFAEQGTEGMDVTAADSYSDLLDLLITDAVDVAVMPRINGLVAIKSHNLKEIRELEGVLETLFLYHYVHKKNEALVPKLEKILKEMLLNGTTRRLRDETYAQILNESE